MGRTIVSTPSDDRPLLGLARCCQKKRKPRRSEDSAVLARPANHPSVALSLRSAPGSHSRRCCRQPACSSKGSTSGGPSGPAHQPWLTAVVEMTTSLSHHMWPCRPKRLRNLRAKRTWSCKTFTKVTVISNLQLQCACCTPTTQLLFWRRSALMLWLL